MEDAIATAQLIAVQPDGQRRSVTISVGRPRLTATEAACSVLLDDIAGNRPLDVRGEDTFQALGLALRFVRNCLHNEEERGVRFLLDDDDEPFDWRRCWFSEKAPR